MPHEHNQARPTPDEIEDGIPATSEAPPHLDSETVEEEAPPLDRPMGVEDWGTTTAEELRGEPLDLRRRREVPDYLAGDILDPEGEDELSAIEATLGAEHAALRIEEEPPGLSYAPDPGYLSDDDR
jgi:hypothetical protein